MKGMQGRLPLLVGLVFLPLALIVVAVLIAGSPPDAPHLTDTGPVRIGGATAPGTATPTGATATPTGATAHGPATPQFRPDPPDASPGNPSTTRPASGPTTQVRPPVQRRPAPAPGPDDADDDESDDDDHDDDDDD